MSSLEQVVTKSGRKTPNAYAELLNDLHPPLDRHEAQVEADKCYFCFDAPCITECPTEIDIPMFIRQIATGNPFGAAETIFEQNIFGGMCARVCPTETLCEQSCVREKAEGKPVKIGLLQRYATDMAIADDRQFFERASATGKRIAVIGAGPAGLSCAHRLATKGHDVDVYETREKPGGLNEYGIATYKAPGGFAQSEVDYITSIGGIDISYEQKLGTDIFLKTLSHEYDAVFLGLGLSGVNALGDVDTEAEGNLDAIGWISALRQSKDLAAVPVGDRVVVIGGGMTAVDAAVQAKGLGAREVTICYRGPKERMKASPYEQEIAQTRGISIRYHMTPSRMVVENGSVTGMEFESEVGTVTVPCDTVMKAIGQTFIFEDLNGSDLTITLEGGRIRVDDAGQTSMPGIWAGGDCVNAGDDLTVTAVAQGRDAAESIHIALSA